MMARRAWLLVVLILVGMGITVAAQEYQDTTPPVIIMSHPVSIMGISGGGAVDANCQATVFFEATITDNCCIQTEGVTVNVEVTTGNATLSDLVITKTHIVNPPEAPEGEQVHVSGSVVVSALTGCPATVQVTINATDCEGNVAPPVTWTTNVTDGTPPVITLVGDNPMNLMLGDTYSEPGATATDNCCLPGPVVIGGDTVDTSSVGTYEVTYDISDCCGNVATQVTRTVYVASGGGGGGNPAPPAPSPVYFQALSPTEWQTVCDCQPTVCVRISATMPNVVDEESIRMRINDINYILGMRGVMWDEGVLCVNLKIAGQVLPIGVVQVMVWAGLEESDRTGFKVYFFQVGECAYDEFFYLPGWNIVSLPLASTMEFSAIPLPVLWWWNTSAGAYEVVADLKALSPTGGYWVDVPEPGTTATACGDLVTSDVTVELGVRGWHMISAPWCYEREDVRFVLGEEIRDWEGAVVEGWIGDALWWYDPSAEEYYNVIGLNSWLGYWILAKAHGLKVVLAYDAHYASWAGMKLAPMSLLPGAPVPPPPPSPKTAGLGEVLEVANLPNPITDVNTTMFAVKGAMAAFVDAVKVEIFDLSGRKVYEEEMPGASLVWHTKSDYGEYLANGVYLWKLLALVDGEWIVSEVKKLAILR